MYFLMPNGVTSADGIVSSGFASMKEFQQWFSNPLGKAVENAGMEGDDGEVDDETRGMVSKLHTLLRPYLLRRLKADVEKELPNKYEHVIRCRLSKRQKFLYNDFMSRAKTRESLASGNYLSIINCLMQLRKVCNHPDLFEQRPIVTSFASERSVVADYEIKELLIRKELLHQHNEDQVDLKAVNLIINSPDQQHLTPIITRSLKELDASASLPKSTETEPVKIDTWTVEGYKASIAQQRRTEKASQWKHNAYVNRLRCQASPPSMFNLSSVKTIQTMVNQRHLLPLSVAEKDTRGFLNRCDSIHRAVLSYDERRNAMQDVIDRYAFVTPRAVTNDIAKWALPGFNYNTMPQEMLSPSFDTLHQPAVKLQIAFPDASLLQYDCGKLQELALLMQRCKTGGHRILIFTQMTKILDILETWLSLNGFKYLRLDGSTKIEDRQALTERFNRDDRIKAFILSTRSGGLGINLTGADMVLFWDLDWNFQIEAQCMDRAHRIGQTRDVHIYRFVSEHTIEENMLKKSNEKRMLDNMVIQNGQFTTEGLSKMSWIESMFDEGGKTIAGVQIGTASKDQENTNDRRIETAMNQAEDEEDARAARQAQMELNLLDNDFEIEMSQDKEKKMADGAAPGDVVNQVAVVDEGGEEVLEEEEDAGTIDDYMLKRVDADWDYFVNL
jgi:helicase SWR1